MLILAMAVSVSGVMVSAVMLRFLLRCGLNLLKHTMCRGESQAGVKRFPLGDFRKRGGNVEVKLVPVVGLTLLFARNHRPDRRNGLAKVGIADRAVGVIPEIAGRPQQLH